MRQLPNAFIYESIKNIDRLSERVCDYLQIDKKQHILHVLARQREVVVVVEEPILANQLKYQQKAILIDLNQALLTEFKTIKIKLSPPRMVNATAQTTPQPLPKDIIRLLDQVRSDLEMDK